MAANAPWEAVYPPGLRTDAAVATYPVHSVLDEAAGRWGERPALDFRGCEISYVELKQLVDRAAQGFLSLGVKPGERIALYLPNTPWHPVAFFGALKAGAVVVHVSPLDAPRVVEHKLRDSGARILVTTDLDGLAERAEPFLAPGALDLLIVGEDAFWSAPSPSRLRLDTSPPLREGEDGRQAGHPSSPPGTGGEVSRRSRDGEGGAASFSTLLARSPSLPLPAVGVEDLALLQYTGGTTGMPKAAMLTHRNLSASVSSYDLWSDAWGLLREGRERILLYLPLFHIYGLSAVLIRALRSGQTTLLRTRFDAASALDEIEAGVTIFPGVPTMWIAICATPGFEKRDLSSLFAAGSGGAPIPVEVARRFMQKTGLELLGGWGMSETAPAGTNLPRGRPDKAGTIGVPMPGIALRVVSLAEPTRELPQGETGELAIRGANVMSGYWNRPEENAAAFADGWFLTGDIGHMDEEGFFTIVDRKKDMIISGGYNVYPQMIEQAIYEHPDVEEVLVIGVADAYRGEAAKAFVKLCQGAAPLTLETLRAFLKTRLGPHELPAALEIRDALPRTPVGKLSKLELKREEAERVSTAKAS